MKIQEKNYFNHYSHSVSDTKQLTKNSPKRDNASALKRGPHLRQKNIRQNANIKSRAIVSTDSSSSEDENNTKHTKLSSNRQEEKIAEKLSVRSIVLSPHDKISRNERDSSSEDVDEQENQKVC